MKFGLREIVYLVFVFVYGFWLYIYSLKLRCWWLMCGYVNEWGFASPISRRGTQRFHIYLKARQTFKVEQAIWTCFLERRFYNL